MTDRVKKIKAEIEKRKSAVSVQEEIANDLGISQSYVSLILNGKRPIPKHRETDFDNYFNKKYGKEKK